MDAKKVSNSGFCLLIEQYFRNFSFQLEIVASTLIEITLMYR